ncbi:L-seryl-tRNA(Sec) selenium transferase [Chloroflexota bacterium]
MKNMFRHLPSVDKVLSDERIRALENIYLRPMLLSLVRQHMERHRVSVAAGRPSPSFDEMVAAVCAEVHALETPTLHPVINASGIILHTNLGRASLSKEAIAAMDTVASSYCNLEFDVDTGKRGSRHTHIEPLLRQLTGAEAALTVNNNASAVLLALTALTRRKEVIVSRGEAVEIGGGFRIPDVMRQSGAKLIEVGTTNCTYIADYEQAISPRTVALLRVHSSNFRISGFTHSVALDDLVALGNRHGLPVLDDLGSGCLLDTTSFGLDTEPMLQQSVAAGAGLVFSSGDKLIGGPQAGIIVGKKQLVDRLKKHPLARAVRIDKIRLAGLAATLTHYLKGEATEKIPVWCMVSTPLEHIEPRALAWAQAAHGLAQVTDDESMVGGGSLPGGTLPTKVIAIGDNSRKGKNTAQALNEKLRQREIPVIGRVSGNMLLLDPRSVLPEEDKIVLLALHDITASLGSS